LRYPENIRFECQRCAKCCGDTPERERNILLLEPEVKQISAVMKLEAAEFSNPSSGTEPYRYVMKKKEGKCIFLEGIDCQIYSHRPLICRFYPFSLKGLGAESYEFKVSDECPGVGLGKVIKEEDFRAMLNKALNCMQ
jgi:hypothetical protein